MMNFVSKKMAAMFVGMLLFSMTTAMFAGKPKQQGQEKRIKKVQQSSKTQLVLAKSLAQLGADVKHQFDKIAIVLLRNDIADSWAL